ncbi:MAG: response regulator [Cyanobacteria bacterium P01_A01_bin.135]
MATHKILVIDDSRVIRNMVKDMLPKGNFQVIEAKDGIEGLTAIQEQRPNLIMLDFLLPRMSGWEVFQTIQEQPSLQKIPLVVMSGRREEVTEKISEPFEYFEFIEKPFEQRDLIGAIKSAMTKAKLPRQAAAAATDASGGADVQAMTQRIETLEKEVATLKRQMGQLVTFIKQRLSK